MKKILLLIFILIPLAGCESGGNVDELLGVKEIFENETASWIWPARPVAERYVGEYDKTYFGWVSNEGEVYVASYDHENSDYVKTKIYDWGVGDDHNQPALHIREDGRIIAFAGGHNEHNIPYFISENAEDISSFGEEKQIQTIEGASGYSYPQPIYLSDEEKIYLFFRRDTTETETSESGVRAWGFAVSDDDGETFVENDTLLFIEDDVRSPYAVPISNGIDTIYFARSDWKLGHFSYVREDIRFIKYNSGNFYRIDDSQVGTMNDLPISKHDMDIVYDSSSEGRYAFVSDIALNDQEYPVIAFTTLEKGNDESEEYDGSGMNYHNYATWDGEYWNANDIIEAGGDILEPDNNSHPAYNGGIMINHDDPNEVVLGREIGELGSKKFEIEIWSTKDNGKEFEKTSEITANNENLPDKVFRPYIPRNHHKDFKVLFIGGDYTRYQEWETYLFRTYIGEYIANAYVKADDDHKAVKSVLVKNEGVWEYVGNSKIIN